MDREHLATLHTALARYDEADASKRITSGDDLRHWEAEATDAAEEIAEVLDDIGIIECARLLAKVTSHD